MLVGGLGMGFTLRSALDHLPADAEVVVAELNPIMVRWCRGPMAHLTGGAVDDPRARVVIGDVATVIRSAAMKGKAHHFDAIILDLYEGPHEGDRGRGEHLYGDVAIELSRSALKPGGVFAVWSEDPDKTFEKTVDRGHVLRRLSTPGPGGGGMWSISPGKTSGPGGGSAGKKNGGPAKTPKKSAVKTPAHPGPYRCQASSCDTSACNLANVSGVLNSFRHSSHLL